LIHSGEKKIINICFLSHSSGIAGAEKAFPKLIEGLMEKGICVHVLIPENGPIEKVLLNKQINYSIIKYTRWINSDSLLMKRIKRTIRNFIMVIPVAASIKKHNCNIVYSNTSTICTGAITAKVLGLPHIWHFREFGSEDYGYKYDLGKKVSQWLLNTLSTICLTNSKAVEKKYKEFIPENKLRVLYETYKKTENIESYNETIILNKSSFNAILIGTLHEAKGHIDAIKALSILVEEGLDIKLFVVGTGDDKYKTSLLTLINKLKIQNHIEFLGHLERPREIMEQCDVVLTCSKKEAFGLVTLEAMQSGIPVIGTRSGGTIELIADGITGYLYQPENSSDLADKIRLLYKNQHLIEILGNNAKLLSERKFRFEEYIDNTYNIISDLLD
jgi:glycosyltransferase involved in cell wall biosynthesis